MIDGGTVDFSALERSIERSFIHWAGNWAFIGVIQMDPLPHLILYSYVNL